MDWTWLALPGFVAGALEIAAGAVVLAMAPRRRANRALGASLVLDAGIPLGVSTILLDEFDLALGTAAATTMLAATAAALACFLVFLSTLDTPLVAWLRPAWVRGAVLGAGLLGAALLIVPNPWVPPVFEVSEGPAGPREGPVVIGWAGAAAAFLLPLYFIACAVHAWRRAPAGSLRRRQASRYAVAFGFRDAAWLLFLVLVVFFLGDAVGRWGDGVVYAVIVLPALITLVFVALLAYGIASASLFDIDLRVRRGLRTGTPVAAMVAVFFVATVTAENFLTSRYGWLVGGAAAGLLLFALSPLQRLGERLARKATPEPTPEYLAFRKLDVYRAAVESAYEEGGVSAKERAILVRTAAKLGIAPADAKAIERDVAPRPA